LWNVRVGVIAADLARCQAFAEVSAEAIGHAPFGTFPRKDFCSDKPYLIKVKVKVFANA
jgi:hypothetical protein